MSSKLLGKKKIKKNRVFLLFVLVFIVFIITFIIISKCENRYICYAKLRADKMFFIPSLGPTNKTFDKNPILSQNEKTGISCRVFMQTKSKYEYLNINIDPDKTAIIAIDLRNKKENDKFFNKEIFSTFVDHKIVPLFELARRKNITIVHAPSHKPYNIHDSILVYPEDLVISNYRNADKELSSRGIDTLLYVGYDSLYCVLDKPAGIFQTHLRSDKFKTILIRDGVISRKDETNQVAINIIESNLGCSITINDIYNYFSEEAPKEIFYNLTFPEKASFDLNKNKISFNPKQIGLVIVNYFSPIQDKKVRQKTDLLIEYARLNNISLIYIESLRDIPEEYELYSNEHLINSEEQFMNLLKSKKMSKLFYAGHFLNSDMLFGPGGITRLYIKKRYEFKKLPDLYIINNASLAFETPETLPNNMFQKTLLKYPCCGVKTVQIEDFIQR